MTAPHDKLAGIKPGDRVRVTFEGVALASPADDRFTIQTTGGRLWVEPDLDNPPVAERIEPPLKVGAKVARKDRPKGAFGSSYELRLIAIRDDQCVVEMWNGTLSADGKAFGLVNISDLERIA